MKDNTGKFNEADHSKILDLLKQCNTKTEMDTLRDNIKSLEDNGIKPSEYESKGIDTLEKVKTVDAAISKIKTGASDMLYDIGKITRGEGLYEFTAKDGTIFKVVDEEIPASSKGIIDWGVEGRIISETDRLKLSKWTYPPKDDLLYLKYKNIYDDPKYFRQTDGYAYHPGTYNPELGYTDVNKDGFLNGEFTPDYKLEKGKVLDRYGDNPDGQYFSPVGESYESRALAPYMDTATYTKYQVLKPFNVKAGTIAPWWGREGMGTQFYTDYMIEALDGTFVKATIENLKANKYIIELID